ncbi:hypothetical protein VTJ49DRAFT_3968 [Mycothermus thermophilus]|uniref:Uncharacterized protein n=1 Tax=Humicola insolens TaxID=85995 RepID=A0ABR3V6G8_HUMIN
MTSRSIPPLLEPYLTTLTSPDAAGSLVLLTSVLGTSTNWLVLRHIQTLLRQTAASHPRRTAAAASGAGIGIGSGTQLGSGLDSGVGKGQQGEEDSTEDAETAVLLVSFLRDLTFWREGLARLGVDLEAAARRGRFAFVDGLCGGLFGGSSTASASPLQSQAQGQPAWKRPLTSPAPGAISSVVREAVEQLKGGDGGQSAGGGLSQNGTEKSSGRSKRVVLIMDGLDFVLAASTGSSQSEATHTTILTLASDSPLIHTQETPLEQQHAWFTLSLAHDADLLLSLRPLDTGAARDVSGVIRITTHPTTAAIKATTAAHGGSHEWLYYVGGDGGVRVFERGQ